MIVVALSGHIPFLWTKTQATVIKTYVETRQGGHLTHSYWPRVEYEYSDGKEPFRSNCLQLGGLSFSKASDAQTEVQKFNKGEKIEIRYLSFYSSIATIYPGTSGPLWIVGLGGVFVLWFGHHIPQCECHQRPDQARRSVICQVVEWGLAVSPTMDSCHTACVGHTLRLQPGLCRTDAATQGASDSNGSQVRLKRW